MAFGLRNYSSIIDNPIISSASIGLSNVTLSQNSSYKWKCSSCNEYFFHNEEHHCPSDLKRFLEDTLDEKDYPRPQ